MFSLQKLKVWAELNWFWVKNVRYHKKNNTNSWHFISLAIAISTSLTFLYTLDFSLISLIVVIDLQPSRIDKLYSKFLLDIFKLGPRCSRSMIRKIVLELRFWRCENGASWCPQKTRSEMEVHWRFSSKSSTAFATCKSFHMYQDLRAET